MKTFKLQKLEKANFAHFVSHPLDEKLPKDLFWQNGRLLKALKQKRENSKFAHFLRLQLWWNTIQTPVLTKLEDFQSFEAAVAASNTWKNKLYPFCKPYTWWRNYLKTSFGKSRSFNKQEADKMKKISSNQILLILEPTF